MRCPKCGYISFDNVSTCLKCKKDISATAAEFQGSTFNVATPSFLKFEPSQEEMEIEGAAEVDGEIEFADPDLEILVDDDDDASIDFSLEDDADTSEDDLALSEEFGEMETFGDDDDDDDDVDLSADLGQFEDVPEDEDTFSFEDDSDQEEEDTFSFEEDDSSEDEDISEETVAAMDIPDELADISDLSPPEDDAEPESAAAIAGEATALEPESESPASLAEDDALSPAAEPEDDLDFSSLDMDLDLNSPEDPTDDLSKQPPAAATGGVDMDEDLNFDLDLGGLSIHDDLK